MNKILECPRKEYYGYTEVWERFKKGRAVRQDMNYISTIEKVWKRKEQPSKSHGRQAKLRFSQEDGLESYYLVEESNADFVEWLHRSLVCTSTEPKELSTLASALISNFGLCTKIFTLN